ncbi:MAG: hypothetical protein F9K18_06330 [Thermoanaerobaculia bacterium]|nr:MAG: hypothetical protein F9K18_06330 [Thermoanaerobaculia bacterium]
MRLERMIWSPAESPLAVHARALPHAVSETARLLAGRAPLPGPAEKNRPGLPDLAFARYGSHALLQWTRALGALALVAGALAGVAAVRAQKALLSRPPQY